MASSQPLKRVQVLLPEDSYDFLVQLSAQEGRSVSALVRETIEEHLLKSARQQKKAEALRQLASLELPVDDWSVMEQEIMDGRYAGHDR